jgi:hypothetical protein
MARTSARMSSISLVTPFRFAHIVLFERIQPAIYLPQAGVNRLQLLVNDFLHDCTNLVIVW